MDVSHFLSGLICMAFLACGLFFLRFWHRSNDRLFLCFGLSFWILAAERLVLGLMNTTEIQPYAYTPRLIAFVIIAVAVADRNRRPRV